MMGQTICSRLLSVPQDDRLRKADGPSHIRSRRPSSSTGCRCSYVGQLGKLRADWKSAPAAHWQSPPGYHPAHWNVQMFFCGAAWQAACRLEIGTCGDWQSPRRIPSRPTEMALFLAVTGLGQALGFTMRWAGCPSIPIRRLWPASRQCRRRCVRPGLPLIRARLR